MNKFLNKSRAVLAILLTLFASGFLVAQETLTFGSSGRIVYDAGSGTADVLIGGTEIIADAYAVVHNGATELNSMNYPERTVELSDISDDFGSGKKMVVNLSGEGLPDLQHIFYAYDGREYFLTEMVLRGEAVSSNYMAPLVSGKVDIGQTGDNRVLFVPFDNDTFIRYRSRSMSSTLTSTSAEVTAFYENNSRHGLIVGSVEHMDWKTGVRTTGSGSVLTELTVWGGYTELNVTRDVLSHGSLSGDSVKSPKMFVGFFEDWRDGLDEYGKANAIAEPRYVFDWEGPTPFGWNSWGAIQTDLNLEKAKGVVDFFAGLSGFRNGETAYIDLDSYWDNMVSGGLEGDFTNLISFVRYCKEKGLKPGIYWGPFVDWGKTERQVEGSSYNYQEVWTRVNGQYHDLDGGRAMDPTHPATKARIDLVIDKFIACGFEMIKIDFIGHATVEADSYYDSTVTTGMQAFRHGMEYLVDRLDGKMFIYAAISPNIATGRYVHSRRIACDAYSDIGATEYTLNSTTYGWWQTHIYNFVDADHLVFASETLGENRARLTSGVINGTLFTGDDFSVAGQWRDRARILLQKPEILDIARNGEAFRPLEGNTAQGAAEVFINTIGDEHYVAVLNYGEEEKAYSLGLDRLGIEAGDYRIRELFSGNAHTLKDASLQIVVGPKDAAIFRFASGTVSSVSPEASNDTVVVYPSPTRNTLTIRTDFSFVSLQVFSLNGKLLIEQEYLNTTEHTIDMSPFEDGVYLVHLRGANGEERVYKAIKKG